MRLALDIAYAFAHLAAGVTLLAIVFAPIFLAINAAARVAGVH